MKARLNYAQTAAGVYLARMLVLREHERAALAWTEAVTLTINDHVDL